MREDVTRSAQERTVVVDQARIERLQRVASVGAVASSVAHEFNNILTTILNQAKLGMLEDDVEAKQQAFEKILSSARRAARVATGVLALSRNRPERKETTDLVDLAEEVLAVLEKDLSKNQVRLERRFEDRPSAEIVPAQIEQVLMNLVINARQAMPKGGTLTVGVRFNQETGMAELSVRDTGTGIEPEKLARIFDPFFTTKQGPDSLGQGGSGLGLSICREIIERHRGRIRVESLLGRGSAFILKLPAQKEASRQAA